MMIAVLLIMLGLLIIAIGIDWNDWPVFGIRNAIRRRWERRP